MRVAAPRTSLAEVIYMCLEGESVSEMKSRESVVQLPLLHGRFAKIFRWFRGCECTPNGGAVG